MPRSVTELSPDEALIASHLSIPRPVGDIANQVRQSLADHGLPREVSEEEVRGTLDALANAGIVKPLGTWNGDAKSLIDLAAADPDTIDVHHDKVRNYRRRVGSGRQGWRAFGEQFHLSKDGVAELERRGKNPDAPDLPLFLDDGSVPQLGGTYDPGPHTLVSMPSVAHHVANEWARTWHDHPDFGALHGAMVAGDEDARRELNDPKNSLAGRLLPWEFHSYIAHVAPKKADRQELVDRLGLPQEYVLPPTQGGAGWADATENLIVDAENGKSTYGETGTTALFLQLIKTTQPTDTDTAASLTQVAYTGYAGGIALAAADMTSASAGSSNNSTQKTYPGCTAGSDTAIALAKTTVSATAAGRLIKYSSITSVAISTTQTPPTIAATAYVTSAD